MPTSRTLRDIEMWATSLGVQTVTAPSAFEALGVTSREVTIMEPQDKILIGGTGAPGTESREVLLAESGTVVPMSGTYAGVVWCPNLGGGTLVHVWVL